MSEAGLGAGPRVSVDSFVEGEEGGMRLQAVLSSDNEDSGGVLAGSPPTALHTVGVLFMWTAVQTPSPQVARKQPAKLHNLAFERQTLRETVFILGEKKMYLLSLGTAEVEGQWKTPLSPRAGIV